MSNRAPPSCYICGKSCESSIADTYYCICDIAICHDCINSTKKNDKIWVCPHCKEENDLEKSKLFRST
ncbi:MAG: hypothetical protein ACXAEX_17185 [Promethearchaeota archaeon]|jgi:hypothetical protein